MGHVDTLLFDKTGTLTEGNPEVTDVLALAAAATHPLARAVLRAAQEMNMAVPEAEEHMVIIGRGIRVRLHGLPLLVGSLRLLDRSRAVRQLSAVGVDLMGMPWVSAGSGPSYRPSRSRM